jgi:hypothetical protein
MHIQLRYKTLASIALSAALAAPASAVVMGTGAEAEVRTCTNATIFCPGPGGTDETITVGGEFSNSASVSTTPGNSTGTARAGAAFTGDAFAPELTAFASTPSGSTGAEGDALAIQSWEHAGNATESFSIAFDLTGTASGAGSDAQIRADVAVYIWDDATFPTGDLATFLFEIIEQGVAT